MIVELCTFTLSPGKSTVAALLERFYDPQEGEVSIDGYNLRSLDPSWVREKVIGYINQEPVLFATTILENIRYGNQNATDQQVMRSISLSSTLCSIDPISIKLTTIASLVSELQVICEDGSTTPTCLATSYTHTRLP